MWNHGTNYEFGKGENHSFAKLKEKEVKIIKRKLKNGGKVIDLAAQFNVSKYTIYDIKLGRTWKNVND